MAQLKFRRYVAKPIIAECSSQLYCRIKEIEGFLEFTGLLPRRPVYIEEEDPVDEVDALEEEEDTAESENDPPTFKSPGWHRLLPQAESPLKLRRRSSTLSYKITKAMSQPFLALPSRRRKCLSLSDMPSKSTLNVCSVP
jgi:hypothetical protein